MKKCLLSAFVLFAIVLIATAVPSVMAQEETPQPTAEVIVETPIATESPAPEATAEPTTELTQEVTAEPTVQPTEVRNCTINDLAVYPSPDPTDWNNTGEFSITNLCPRPMTFKVILDDWNNVFDHEETVTLASGETRTWGLGHLCNKWQLDIVWEGQEKGYRVEEDSDCSTPTLPPTEVTLTPTPITSTPTVTPPGWTPTPTPDGGTPISSETPVTPVVTLPPVTPTPQPVTVQDLLGSAQAGSVEGADKCLANTTAYYINHPDPGLEAVENDGICQVKAVYAMVFNTNRVMVEKTVISSEHLWRRQGLVLAEWDTTTIQEGFTAFWVVDYQAGFQNVIQIPIYVGEGQYLSNGSMILEDGRVRIRPGDSIFGLFGVVVSEFNVSVSWAEFKSAWEKENGNANVVVEGQTYMFSVTQNLIEELNS